jgi:hypothetical protein
MVWDTGIAYTKQTFLGDLTSFSVRSIRSYSSTAAFGMAINAGLAECRSLDPNIGGQRLMATESET